MEKELFKNLVENHYGYFISSAEGYSDTVTAAGGVLIKTMNDKLSCCVAAGMNIAGIRTVIIEDKSIVDFIVFKESFCKDFGIGLVILSKEKSKYGFLSYLDIKEKYSSKLKKKLADVESNGNSLQLVTGEAYAT